MRRLNEYFFPIFPEFFSVIHFAAYYGNAEAVRSLFGVNCLYAADMYGKTPLAYSLEMRHYECSDLIISHFKEHPQQLYVTYKDLLCLLGSKSNSVKKIFSALVTTNPQVRQCPRRGVLKDDAAIIAEGGNVLGRQFAEEKFAKGREIEHREVEYLVSKFRYNNVMGSNKSRELLTALAESEYDEIWESDMRYVIDEKWARLSVFVTTYSVLHFLFLLYLSVYATALLDNQIARLVVFVLALCFYSFEVLQMFVEGLNYFTELWNYFDLMGTLLFIVHTALLHFGVFGGATGHGAELLAVAVFLQWFRVLGDLRAF